MFPFLLYLDVFLYIVDIQLVPTENAVYRQHLCVSILLYIGAGAIPYLFRRF